MPERRGLAAYVARAGLALRVWRAYGLVLVEMRRRPLQEVVYRLRRPVRRRRAHPAPRVSRAVRRCLSIGPRRPRCLVSSLVMLRVLHEQGIEGALVIGLPEAAGGPEAHAWIEVGGRDVGPPPGRGDNIEMMRL